MILLQKFQVDTLHLSLSVRLNTCFGIWEPQINRSRFNCSGLATYFLRCGETEYQRPRARSIRPVDLDAPEVGGARREVGREGQGGCCHGLVDHDLGEGVVLRDLEVVAGRERCETPGESGQKRACIRAVGGQGQGGRVVLDLDTARHRPGGAITGRVPRTHAPVVGCARGEHGRGILRVGDASQVHVIDQNGKARIGGDLQLVVIEDRAP